MKSKNLRLLFVAVLACFLFIGQAYAASASVNIKYPMEVKTGEEFVVEVTYSGDSFSRVEGELKYDPSVIQYVSGGSSSGNGGVVLLKQSSETDGSISFTLKFKATKDGTSDLSVSTVELYNMDESSLNTPSASGTVTVSKDASDQVDVVEKDTDSVDDSSANEDSVETEEVETTSPTHTIGFYVTIAVILIIVLAIIIGITSKRRKR